ncbi:hypothetical protein BCR43DRAFT_316967 [Syncephalastrum racemosum]|uniref:DNA-directed DNA polymerase family B exonuclease domain-containing protein n=1 Tax=Syncephalastrum racemosum TaxID=13706 RepID=A0A1X2HB89_SYNRA|nr:hypothetical protein BCR43DRAFT_316967 [Syncephalastrum racemosum]
MKAGLNGLRLLSCLLLMDRSSYISVRVTNIDHYLTDPGPLDRSNCPFSTEPLTKVPVIRIFGSTPAGQKACLHIHQAYPYFYVPYTLPCPDADSETIQRTIYQFGVSLNHAMRLTPHSDTRKQYLAAIVLVKGVPFYGYHVGYQTYLKLYLLDPADKRRMTQVLQKGAVQGIPYQPYEAHLPFELQFMMDYNLYGMNWIDIHPNTGDAPAPFSLRFRTPLLDHPKTLIFSQQSSGSDIALDKRDKVFYTNQTVPARLQWDALQKTSHCELEIDTTVMTIGNRTQIGERNIHIDRESEHLFTESVVNERPRDTLVKSLATIYADEERRRKARGVTDPIPPSSTFEERTPGDGWESDRKWRRIIDEYIEHTTTPVEPGTSSSVDLSHVLTAFQSVEALYPPGYYVLRGESETKQNTDISEGEPSQASLSIHESDAAYNVSFTPSRYHVLSESTPTEVDLDKMHQLVRDRSFHEADEEQEHDESEAEKEEDVSISSPEEGTSRPKTITLTDFGWPEDVPQASETRGLDEEEKQGFSRGREIDFEAEVKKREAKAKESQPFVFEIQEEDEDEQIMMSEEPPTRNPRRPRTGFRLRQNDGGDDPSGSSSESEQEKMGIHHWDQFYKELKGIRRQKRRRREEDPQPFVEFRNEPRFADILSRHKQRRESAQALASSSEQPSPPSPVLTGGKRPQRGSSAPAKTTESEKQLASPVTPQETPSGTKDAHPEKSNSTRLQHWLQSSSSSSSGKSIPSQHPTQKRVSWSDARPSEPERGHKRQPDAAWTEYIYARKAPALTQPVRIAYREPYYSNPADAPAFTKTFGNKDFKLPTTSLDELKEEEGVNDRAWQQSTIASWRPSIDPPTEASAYAWLQQKEKMEKKTRRISATQIDVPTLRGSGDFEYRTTKPKAKVTRIRDYLDLFSLEIHVSTRGDMLPDPAHDAVQVVFWCLQTEDENIVSNGMQEGYHIGVIGVHQQVPFSKMGLSNVEVDYVESEQELFQTLIKKVRLYDPDILVGYELHNASWGYLIERAAVLGVNLVDALARMELDRDSIPQDEWGYKKASVYRIIGRHMLNVWRIMRGEVALTSYTFENLAYHVLHYTLTFHTRISRPGIAMVRLLCDIACCATIWTAHR